MRIARFLGGLAAAALSTSAGGAAAATLLVKNGDFNQGPAKSDGQYYTGNVIPDWTGTSAAGHWDPGNFHFFNEAAHGGVALIHPGGLKMLTQAVAGHTIAANTRYTLTVDVGLYNGSASFLYDFGLIAGDLIDGLVVAELVGGADATGKPAVPGYFNTLTLSFVTGADDDIIGKQLMIALGGLSGGVSYDNVRLEAVPLVSGVPEPATWAMLITGFAATGVMVRRRRTLAIA